MSSKRIALITGANRSIGFEVSQQLGAVGYTILLGRRAGVVWAATLDSSGPSGGFFQDMQPVPW